MKNNILVSVIVSVIAVAVALGIFGFGEKITERVIEPKPIGSVTGPDMYSPDGCFTFEGVRRCYFRKVIKNSGGISNGTYMPCSFKAPAATSTLLSASFQTTDATSTVRTFGFYRNVLSTATTSGGLLGGTVTIPANGAMATSTIFASSTLSSASVFTPNQFLNFNVQGLAGTGGYFMDASCNAVFEVM
jgi:hypothetical protein